MNNNYYNINEDIKMFNQYNNVVKSFQQFKENHKIAITLKSNNLRQHISRGPTSSQLWKPALGSIGKRLGSEIDTTDLGFNRKEVSARDNLQISEFQGKSPDIKKLKFTRLMKAARLASNQLGINKQFGQYRLTSIEESSYSFQNTSAGLPTMKKKGTDEARTDAVKFASSYFNMKTKTSYLMKQPTILFHRYQFKSDKVSFKQDRIKEVILSRVKSTNGSFNYSETFTQEENKLILKSMSDLNKKIRQVWALPFRIQLIEAVIFRDMMNGCIAHCSAQRIPMSTWGRSIPDISKIMENYRHEFKGYKMMSFDVSSFDANIPEWMFPLFYTMIHNNINFNDLENNKFKLLKDLMLYQCKTPFCHESMEIRFQSKGLASGSVITQLFGTFVNCVVQNYARLEYSNDKFTAEGFSTLLGDDNLTVNKYISERQLTTIYNKFGLSISLEKSQISETYEEISFLGYVWDLENRPTEDLAWYLIRYILPERFINVNTLGISVSEMQTYRMLTTSATTYLGYQIFEYFVGYDDFVYLKLHKEFLAGIQKPIIYVGEDQRFIGVKIPLGLIYDGWISFGGSYTSTREDSSVVK